MAFLSGIFGNSAPAPAAPAPAPAPVNSNGSAGPVSQQQQAPANPGAHPTNMQNQQAPAPAAGPENPLDAFSSMFAPKQPDPNAPKQPTINDPLLGPLDPAKFREQVNQANFAAAIPQETIQRAIGGDPAAFQEAINTAAREAFAAAAQLSHGLVEHGARTAAQRVDGSVDSRVRNALIRTQNTSNEALTHPAVAPLLGLVKHQIAQSNPQLTPDQIQQRAEQYFMQTAEVLTAPKRQQQQEAVNQANKPHDFSYLLEN
jgi:hypothetical protein